MRVLFDIVYPAQVHFFKQVVRNLQQRGDEVLVNAGKKDITVELLNALGIGHICISTNEGTIISMGMELLIRMIRLMKIARTFRPDVMVARVGHSIGIVGKLMGIPTVIYDDMEHAKLQAVIGMRVGLVGVVVAVYWSNRKYLLEREIRAFDDLVVDQQERQAESQLAKLYITWRRSANTHPSYDWVLRREP
jgi:hypothetical protein